LGNLVKRSLLSVSKSILDVLITLGSSKVECLHGAGAGFLIKGKAKFMTSGPDFDFMKEKFSWLRANLGRYNRISHSNLVKHNCMVSAHRSISFVFF